MNRKNLSNGAVRPTLAIALAGLLITAFAPSAFAGQDADAPSTKVRFGDLNLGTDAGVDTLYGRIKSAARQVCRESVEPGDGLAAHKYWGCYDKAIADAVSKVNNSQLTAMYQQNTHRRLG